MTFETLTVIELLLSASNYPEDKCDKIRDELSTMDKKAKAFDEVKEFIIKKLKEEEEEKPRTLLSDYDLGLYQAYDNVDDIIQEYLERVDDERRN